MKIKHFILGLSLGAFALSGCNDELSEIGSTIQPDSDKSFVHADTFKIDAKTVVLDSIYARTIYGTLGQIFDPLYGNLQSDFMCQFYCPENFSFKNKPAGGKIDSVIYKINYGSWIGDSLTPMKVAVFPVTTPLKTNFYTNIDPTQYCDMKQAYGTKSYTAYDMTVPDSIRHSQYFQPNISIELPKEIGERFYNATTNTPEVFKNQGSFNNFFPGLYITNTYGTGNMINVSASGMYIYYKYIVKGSAGQDSLVKASEYFSATNEVVQLNRLKNSDIDQLLAPNDSITYLKSPAGVYTQLTIPAKQIAAVVKDRIISNIPLRFKAYPQEEWKYAFNPPTSLLLLPTDSIETFFPQSRIEDNITSFLAKYSPNGRTYVFGNIANLLKEHIKQAPEKDLVLSLIPVDRNVGFTSSWGGATQEYTISLAHYLHPSGVKLKMDDKARELQILSIEYQ